MAKRLLLAGLAAIALSGAAGRANAETRYVFTTFLGDAVEKEKLSVYTSSDGLNFELLTNTGFGGPTRVLRDPSILKHTDGEYYVAYTLQSWDTNSRSFGIATSSDLERWTFLTEVPAVAGALHTWAPEWFVDSDGVHLIVSVDTSAWQFRAYDFKAKDAALTEWDAPVPLGIGPNYIDTFVVKDGAAYHAFAKNETTKYIEHATASALHGPWSWVGKDDWAGWGSGKEGLSLLKLDNGQWRMFLDCYSGCGFLYADSTDLETWSGTKTVPGGLSGVVRHGTVLREELGGSGGSAGAAGASGAAGRNGGSSGEAGSTNGGAPSPVAGASAGGSSGALASVPGSSAGAGTGASIDMPSGGRALPVSGEEHVGGGQGGANTAGSVASSGARFAPERETTSTSDSSGCSQHARAPSSYGSGSAATGLALLALFALRWRGRHE